MIHIEMEMPGETMPRLIEGEEQAMSVARALYRAVDDSQHALRNARIKLGWMLLQVKAQLPRGEFGAFKRRLGNGHTCKSCMKEAGQAGADTLGEAGVSVRTQEKAMRVAAVYAGADGEPDEEALAALGEPTLSDLERDVGARPAWKDASRTLRANLGRAGGGRDRGGMDRGGSAGGGRAKTNTCALLDDLSRGRGRDAAGAASSECGGRPAGPDTAGGAISSLPGTARPGPMTPAAPPLEREMSEESFAFGDQLTLEAAYAEAERGHAALDEAIARWAELSAEARSGVLAGVGQIVHALSFSSARHALSGA